MKIYNYKKPIDHGTRKMNNQLGKLN